MTRERTRNPVPAPLDELGEAFVPIDPGEKGTRRPRTPEHLFAPGDVVLKAYLDAGHNYGVACRGDLVVLDADEPADLGALIDALPETAWQVSGSRTSEHYFLHVPGLDEDIPLDDPESGENLGHIKAASQPYVVGPGSRHPSGNRYGPLQGDRIATVREPELRELVEPFRPEAPERQGEPHRARLTAAPEAATRRSTSAMSSQDTPRARGPSTRSTARRPARTS